MQTTTVENALLEGINHHQAGRLDEAIRIYRAILDSGVENADALHLLGVALFRRGDAAQALPLIDRALALAPRMAQAHYNRGHVLKALGRAADAAASYGEAAALNPGFVQGQVDLGETLMALGRPADAAAAFAAAAAHDAGNPVLQYRLGEAQDAAGRLPEAQAAYRQAIVLKPDFGEAYRRYTVVSTELRNADRIVATVEANRRRAAAGGAPTPPNIYLKAYSRPFYLDRTIRSLKTMARGFGRLIILNDGIDPAYMAKIQADHPEVEVRVSPKVAGNVIAAPANAVFNARKKHFRELDFFDPARFWWQEIARDPNDYIVAIDEDCWIDRDIDFGALVTAMQANACLGVGLLFQKEEHRQQRKAKNPTIRQEAVGNGTVVDLYRSVLHSADWSAGYDIFPNTQSILLKDYWLNNYDEMLHFTNEVHLNQRAMRLYGVLSPRLPDMTTGFIDGGVVKHSTTSTSRSDAGGKACMNKIDPDLYHDLVSELWIRGEFDSMADFPGDYSTERLVQLMRGRLPDDKIQAWMEWRTEFLKMFYWL